MNHIFVFVFTSFFVHYARSSITWDPLNGRPASTGRELGVFAGVGGDDYPAYVGRVPGTQIVGQIINGRDRIYYSDGTTEQSSLNFDILLDEPGSFEWVPSANGEIVPDAVPIGNGYVGRFFVGSAIVVGNVNLINKQATGSAAGSVVTSSTYHVLVYRPNELNRWISSWKAQQAMMIKKAVIAGKSCYVGRVYYDNELRYGYISQDGVLLFLSRSGTEKSLYEFEYLQDQPGYYYWVTTSNGLEVGNAVPAVNTDYIGRGYQNSAATTVVGRVYRNEMVLYTSFNTGRQTFATYDVLTYRVPTEPVWVSILDFNQVVGRGVYTGAELDGKQIYVARGSYNMWDPIPCEIVPNYGIYLAYFGKEHDLIGNRVAYLADTKNYVWTESSNGAVVKGAVTVSDFYVARINISGNTVGGRVNTRTGFFSGTYRGVEYTPNTYDVLVYTPQILGMTPQETILAQQQDIASLNMKLQNTSQLIVSLNTDVLSAHQNLSLCDAAVQSCISSKDLLTLEMKQQLNTFQAEISTLSSDNVALRANLTSIESNLTISKVDLASCHSRLTSCSSDNNGYLGNIASLNEIIRQLNASMCSNDLVTCQGNLTNAIHRVEDLQKASNDLVNCTTSLSTCSGNKIDLQAQVDNLNILVQQFNASTCGSDLVKCQSSINDIQGSLHTCSQELVTANSSIDACKSELTKDKALNSVLENTLNTTLTSNAQQQANIVQISNELEICRNRTIPSVLNCDYDYLQMYTCNARNLVIKSESTKIESISGTHLPNQNISTVVQLIIANSDTTYLPADIFRHFVSMKTLRISQSKLEFIQPGSFFNAQILENLYIDGNQVGVLKNETFVGANNLKLIQFELNLLESIEVATFKGLQQLNFLSLKGNKLHQLDADVFSELVALKTLTLSFNRLMVLDGGLLRFNKNLKSLYVSNNLLTKIGSGLMVNAQGATVVEMLRNQCVNQVFVKMDLQNFSTFMKTYCA